MDIYKVSSNVDAWCTKCRLILAHTIEAVLDNKIKRVKCNTCNGSHQFRDTEPGSQKIKKTLKSKANGLKTKSKPSDLVNLLHGKDLSKALMYNIKSHFSKGDLVNHTAFGLGVVVDERDVNKIEVLFEEGAKLLVHARQ